MPSAQTGANVVKMAYAASIGLVGYEWFLHLEGEVDYFWQKPVTLTKCLFLANRYITAIFLCFAASVFLQWMPSPELCRQYFIACCFFLDAQVMVTHAILALRIYAMYESSKKIRNFLFGYLAVEFCAMFGLSLYMVVAVASKKVVSSQSKGVFVCGIGSYVNPGYHVRPLLWYAIVLVAETGFLLLALRKAWIHRSSNAYAISLMRRVSEDSIVYFIILFLVYILNLILWSTDQGIINASGVPLFLAFTSILTTRLLMNLKSGKHGDLQSPSEPQNTSGPFFSTIEFTSHKTEDRDTEDIRMSPPPYPARESGETVAHHSV